jgi:hypothetical protein
MARRPKDSPKRKNRKNTDKEQSERFIETARMLEADENGARFEEVFAKIVPPKRREKNPHR